jgi:adenosylcobinamide amidohydrolase
VRTAAFVLSIALAQGAVAQTLPPSVAIDLQTATTLVEAPTFVARRVDKFCVVELRGPHRVMSTSPRTGGVSESVKYLVNYQNMEAAGDMVRHDRLTAMSREAAQADAARMLGLEPSAVALMGTAANMNYLAMRQGRYRDLRVDVFVTAGVEGNAGRAGDPAYWYEGEKGFEQVPHGTINTIVIINKPLTPGAQARAAITMVEAKSAALSELAVPSGASSHLATGTGTDQFVLAVALEPGVRAMEDAGTHSKLGELIGDTVRQATLEALRWQNGLERSYTRNVTRALGRFGLTDKELHVRLQAILPKASYDLLKQNEMAVVYEPRVAAAAYAYAAVLDRLQYGTLPEQLAATMLRDQSANVAVALSSKLALLGEYWMQIPEQPKDRLEPFVKALALGWQTRWTSNDAASAATSTN